jgi:sulfatase maturation enzyme AslB (radical SAM superfamily)
MADFLPMMYQDSPITKVLQESTTFNFATTVSDYCNYSCHYCWPGAHAGTMKLPPPTDIFKHNIKKYCKWVKKHNPKIENFYFHYSGGEPSMFPHMSDYLKFVADEIPNGYSGLQTNGSRTIRWWEKNLPNLHSLSISVHVGSADPNHLIELAKLCEEHKVDYNLNVAADLRNKKKVLKFLELFSKNNLQTGFHLIQEIHETWDDNDLHTNKEFYEACDSFTAHYQDRNSNSELQRKVTFETEDSKKPIKFDEMQRSSMRGDWTGYDCNTPAQFMMINSQGHLYISCGNKIGPLIKKIDLFKSKLSVIPAQPWVRCTTGYCKCTGLWHANKQLVIK